MRAFQDWRNRCFAASVTGAKTLTRFPSGSRMRSERFPHGIVVGGCTTSVTLPSSFANTASTSSARNSMIAVWFAAGCAGALGEQLHGALAAEGGACTQASGSRRSRR